VDGDYPAMNMRPHVYADLARQLSGHGFTVLRMAKIGPGTGSRTVDAAAASGHSAFETRVEVAQAALDLLRARRPAEPLYVAGHSEGAVVASLLAARSQPGSIRGVVSLSGPALPIFGIMREQLEAMPMAPADLAAFDEGIASLRAGQGLPKSLSSQPSLAPLAAMPPLSLAYLISCDRIDPRPAAGQVRQPMLIVQGLRDDSVAPHHADDLAAARVGLPTRKRLFPGLTHFYKRAEPGLNPQQAMALTTDCDPAVAAAIAAWS
jgi:alpha-beta hydrolase superfamily lysophospholipase